MSLHPNQVLLAPVVSEKSYSLITDRKYTFKVHEDAHKTQIRQAVEELFEVKVAAVNIVKVQSKPKRRGLTKGRRPGWKIIRWCMWTWTTRAPMPGGRASGCRPKRSLSLPLGADCPASSMPGGTNCVQAASGWPTRFRGNSL